MAESRSMKKPLHATLTTPPLVEYVAVGRGDGDGVAGPAGGRPDPVPGTVVTVVGGDNGGTGTLGGGAWDGDPTGSRGLGLPAADPRPLAGTVEVEAFAGTVVLVGVPADGSGSSSLTTSWCARTTAGRSVTSAATMEVAVHTTAVDATVATSHSPMANTRDSGTSRGCLLGAGSGLRQP